MNGAGGVDSHFARATIATGHVAVTDMRLASRRSGLWVKSQPSKPSVARPPSRNPADRPPQLQLTVPVEFHL